MILRHIATRQGKLQSFLRNELSLSYGLLKRLKYQDAYQVNGVPVHTPHMVHPGDVITATIEEVMPDFPAEHGVLSVLYEDEALLVLDKPAGIIMHPTFNRIQGTLANSILGYYQRTNQQSAIHFISRLDRDTFGVVMVAKNAHVHALLCEPPQPFPIEKTYHAAVFGHPPELSGVISHPIARLSPTSLLRCVREDGKSAISHYTVLETNRTCSLLSLRPKTGRTHQLRVHCAHEGFPLLGDVQYGTEASQLYSAACGVKTHQLCAISVRFVHPLTGEPLVICSNARISLPDPTMPK